MFVVSLEKALAIPKSINFKWPFTNTKFAGFKSPEEIMLTSKINYHETCGKISTMNEFILVIMLENCECIYRR